MKQAFRNRNKQISYFCGFTVLLGFSRGIQSDYGITYWNWKREREREMNTKFVNM